LRRPQHWIDHAFIKYSPTKYSSFCIGWWLHFIWCLYLQDRSRASTNQKSWCSWDGSVRAFCILSRSTSNFKNNHGAMFVNPQKFELNVLVRISIEWLMKKDFLR
jgi:hypothetical protein